jgi:hypothetical protein
VRGWGVDGWVVESSAVGWRFGVDGVSVSVDGEPPVGGGTRYAEDQRIGVDKEVDPRLESPRMRHRLPSRQGRVAAPPGADGRGQTVAGYVQALTPSAACGDTSP